MNEDLEVLKRERGALRQRFTKFKTFIDTLPEELSAAKVLALEERVKKISAAFDKYEEVQDGIDNLSENIVRSEIEDIFFEALGEANMKIGVRPASPIGSRSASEIMSGNNNDKNSNVSGVINNSLHDCGVINNSLHDCSIKLPTIELKIFEGKYEHWTEFKEIFDSLIKKNKNLSDIQRFHYLRASLKDEAAEIIKSFDFCASNFDSAWEALNERYDNSKLLIHNHLRSLFEQNVVRRDNFSDIRLCVDTTLKNIRALKNLGEPTDSWDTLIVFILCNKLDKSILRDWEQRKVKEEKPTLKDFVDFLKSKADLLETWAAKDFKTKVKVNVASTRKCFHCNQDHSLYKCEEFLKLDVDSRSARIKELKLCLNCLSSNHWIGKCKVSKGCFKCKGKHNTLLHKDRETTVVATASIFEKQHSDNLGILATAQAWVKSNSNSVKGRMLLDCGSQSNLITESFARECCARFDKTDITLIGVSSKESRITNKCTLKLTSIISEFTLIADFFVVKNITDQIPTPKLAIGKAIMPKDLPLADPNFERPEKVDMLLGSSHFWDLIQPEKRVKITDSVSLQGTMFGWLVVGRTPEVNNRFCFLSNVKLNDSIKRFFECEDVIQERVLSLEESECEKLFRETTKVHTDGKFIVKIPLKESVEKLGTSRDQAEKRFLSLERRLSANPNLKEQYVSFLREYESLGHMKKADTNDSVKYYLPHHCVIRNDSETTKLRVVFNASAPTSSGLSLNDIQCIGPQVQGKLYGILIRFRQHEFVLTGDIEKMYRQVWISPEQVDLQRILWRENPTDELEEFALLTVTYGSRSASYLATKSLTEVGNRAKHEHPVVALVIKDDFYVDDFLTGTNSISELMEVKNSLENILRRSGFHLHKYKSNCSELLNISNKSPTHDFSKSDNVSKLLGISWNSVEDNFRFTIKELAPISSVTKRHILSDISSVFDPLGLLGIATITLKIFMQKLWLCKIGWDDEIDEKLKHEWIELRSQIGSLNDVRIPRKICIFNAVTVHLHGFSDASELAYGCCVYMRTVNSEGTVKTELITSKSRVAPIKGQTIPRLELSAANLLAELMDNVIRAFRLKIDKTFYWSDSTITLHWISTVPGKLQTYVANRVGKIHELTNIKEWRHVPGIDNPADLISRGVKPELIPDADLWWHGPTWLSLDEDSWPTLHLDFTSDPIECKKVTVMTATVVDSLFNRFSSLTKLQRTVAYCIRFINNSKVKKSNRIVGNLTIDDMNESLERLIMMSQKDSFESCIKELSQGKELKRQSRIASLAPFIDSAGMLRVGGRLKNADIPDGVKHPILLQGTHGFCKLLFEHEHKRLLHAAPQLLLYTLRERYWVLGGRSLSKTTVHKCLTCFRFSAKQISPKMGNLPNPRINVSNVHFKGQNGARFCLFICFPSKAVHLELVSSLSSEAFLAALKRFVARRGKPNNIYSDNGTNYVGAAKELGEFIKSNANQISNNCVISENIRWHFIPPTSPHFGGLWERAVQSVKYHLRRIVADRIFTYEHFSTFLVQIEAVINSRPLSPLSPDPHDLRALTPAHLVVGKSLTSIPENNVTTVPVNRCNLYQQLQAITQHFWTRWSKEYLTDLQERQKWQQSNGSLKLDALVLLKDDQQPPMCWKLGRVIKLYYGSDNIARVADIKTENGVLKRSFSKICPLPVDD